MATDVHLATYTGDPAGNARDAVRLLIGDTDAPDGCVFKDAEIDFFLTQANNDVNVAARSAMAVQQAAAARTAGTRTIGKTTVTDNRATAFKDASAALVSASPVGSTGTVVSFIDVNGATPSIFDYGMDDAPGSGLRGGPHQQPVSELNMPGL